MRSTVDKIRPGDERVQSHFVEEGGRRWHYLEALPADDPKGTIVLVHGFPDLSLGWRYQIPHFVKLGYRTIALDCMGYGKTGFSPSLQDYTFLSHANALAAIARQTDSPRLILGGHDWGGAVVYRAAQWLPDLVAAVFSIATPYAPTTRSFVSTRELAEGRLPNFGYQLQFGSEEGVLEGAVDGKVERVGAFLRGIYGWGSSKDEGKRPFMTPERGVDLEMVRSGDVGGTPLLDDEELAFYTSSFHANPLAGPTNWYRTRRLNFEDELRLPEARRNRIEQPVLFVQALKDNILVPALSQGMESRVPNLTRGEVRTGHWALWQAPEEVNRIVGEWLQGLEGKGVVGSGGSRL